MHAEVKLYYNKTNTLLYKSLFISKNQITPFSSPISSHKQPYFCKKNYLCSEIEE